VIDGRLWHNPGAIGIPANDGTPRVWFSVLQPVAGGVEIRHLPLNYDFSEAAAAMRKAGLPAGYSGAMESGLWPSTDVLPPAELAGTGLVIELAPVLWPRAAFEDYIPAAESRPEKSGCV
jgi:hypothetical protein